MEKITDTTYFTIKKLILNSNWGKDISVNELLRFLYDEVEEFADSCRKKNIENIYEEAADVLMMLLYTVIKEADNIDSNPIEYILENIDNKLKRRYSVFFEGRNDIDEEEYWKQTKKLEKNVVPYLYCSNSSCSMFGKINKGHMKYHNRTVECTSCGHTGALGEKNLLLCRCENRRYIFEKLLKYYDKYILGIEFAEDDYFINEKGDYFKIVKYIVKYPTGYLAICNMLDENKNSDFLLGFLMKPLRNHIMKIDWLEERLLLDINDFFIKCVNLNYKRMTHMICDDGDDEYREAWLEYLKNLFRGMETRFSLREKKYVNSDFVRLEESYDFFIDERRINVIDRKEHHGVLKKREIIIDFFECEANCHILQAFISIMIELGIEYQYNLNINFVNIKEKLLDKGIKEAINDLFPNQDICWDAL